MEYRRFGKTNEMLSVITLGGMRFPHAWDAPRDELPADSLKNCLETTRQALQLGINHIETAYGYVKSEHLYGAVLKELNVPRSQFKMMTKGAPMSADETKQLVESQLQALQLDFVDFYGWHGINNKERLRAAVQTGGPVETLHRLKEQGLVRHIGFSTHAPLDIISGGVEYGPVQFCQFAFLLFLSTQSSGGTAGGRERHRSIYHFTQ